MATLRLDDAFKLENDRNEGTIIHMEIGMFPVVDLFQHKCMSGFV